MERERVVRYRFYTNFSNINHKQLTSLRLRFTMCMQLYGDLMGERGQLEGEAICVCA